MKEWILETPRLFLRKIQRGDHAAIGGILQDPEIMYAWEHGFTQDEVNNWIEANLLRYDKDGYGYWAVSEKTSGQLVGVCGLIAEKADGEDYTGIGYIFNKAYWGRGYAFESAKSCIDYGFQVLQCAEITAQIRPGNAPSKKVAEKLGMTAKKQFIKIYRGKEMPHLLYSITAKEAKNAARD